jgi:pyridoxal phosphate enzyme (YggS family)
MVKERIAQILASIPSNVQLVAVSKTHSVEKIMEAYDAGQRHFGENKVQELVEKYEALPKDICWHMIGHLQSNKVKYLASFVHLIHGVDSIKLLQEIDRQGVKHQRNIPCLLQFHIAQEQTKFGLTIEEAKEMLTSTNFDGMKHISLHGVMGMATFTENAAQIREEFKALKRTFMELKAAFFETSKEFKEISMGMSDDYPIATEEGSTIIRVGSEIFGQR